MKIEENMYTSVKSNDLSSILENPVFPHWMSITMKINSEYRLFENSAQRLYHYTSLEGFQSIMQKRDFWISNIRYMNDSHEFENGKAICREVIEAKLGKVEKAELSQYLHGLLNVCDQKISQGLHMIDSKDIFSLSFCDDGDILTQWQSYGNEGIAIGFENVLSFDRITFMNEDQYDNEIKEVNPDEMLPHDEIGLFPIRIMYRDKEKKEIFESILEIGINYIKKYPDTVNMCIEGISDALFYYFALMKDAHFQHEQELRFIYYSNKDNSRIHFRKRNGILLPYIKMKILDANCRPHKVFPISDIVVAPSRQKEYVAESVKYFLEKSGYEYLINKVRVSEIPYRN